MPPPATALPLLRGVQSFLICILLSACATVPLPSDHSQVASIGWSSTDDGRPAPDFLSSCAASVAQKIFLINPAERENSPELYAGVGRYMWLTCASSSPAYGRAQYALQREKQSAKAESDTKACAANADCIARINKQIDGVLMRCLAYQRQNASIIANLSPETVTNCAKDKL